MAAVVKLHGDVGFCNAVRRTLLADVPAWAPYQLTVRANTSTMNDEFLAHRIGLVPFRRVGNGTAMTLTAHGPCTVRAGDVVGPAFEPVHPGIEVATLAASQELDVTIHFDERTGATHARYQTCAGVGMCAAPDGTHHILRFDSVHGTPARDLFFAALDRLDARVDGALHALAHQPSERPRSVC